MPNQTILTALKNQQRLAGLDIHSPLCLKPIIDPINAGDISTLYQLVDKAADHDISLIQFCPIHDTGDKIANPYLPLSIFSLNPVYVDLADLPNLDLDRFLAEYNHLVHATQIIGGLYNYQSVYRLKLTALRQSFQKSNPIPKEFAEYKEHISPHVLTYIKYKTISSIHGEFWTQWPDKLRDISNVDSKKITDPVFQDECEFQKFVQWILTTQWQKLVTYAQNKNISFITDKPIYNVPNSAEVWANPELFYLNKDGTPEYISGCNNPGDPFGQQTWNQAIYRFKEKPEEVTQLFLDNIDFLSQISSVIRLDNTLSLIWKYYLIDPNNHHGHHETAIKDKLFKPLLEKFPDIFFIAEDVGYLSEKDVDIPLEKLGLPGLRCYQWYYDKFTRLADYPVHSVAITSNHDTQSTQDWIQTVTPEDFQHFKEVYPELPEKKHITAQDIMYHVFNTPSQLAIATLRDLEGDGRRYNLPGTDSPENWSLRMIHTISDLDLNPLQDIIQKTNRKQ